LPITILALAVLLGQKCTLLVTAALADFPASAAAAEPAAPAVPPVVNWDSTQPPPAVCLPETTINPSEIAPGCRRWRTI
jgi:hypothetical protein